MGEISSRILPFWSISDLQVISSEKSNDAVEQIVMSPDDRAEAEAADADSPPVFEGEHKIVIGKTDTTEIEFDMTNGSWLFEVVDSEGMIIYQGNDTADLIEGFAIAQIEYEKARIERFKTFKNSLKQA